MVDAAIEIIYFSWLPRLLGFGLSMNILKVYDEKYMETQSDIILHE